MFGDGATNIGYFHEALNLSKVWNLSVLWVCENNLYGMGTAVERASAVSEIRQKAEGYKIPNSHVDGMDIIKVRDEAQKAIETARVNKTPYFLEVETYRFRGHSMGDPERYRTSEEVRCWQEEEDPIGIYHKYLLDNKIANLEELDGFERSAVIEIQEAVKFAVPATIDFATADILGLAGSDYAATNGTLSFAAEEVSKQFSVPILNDGVKEAIETFRLDLSNAVGGVLGTRSNAIVTIEDNDGGFQVELSTYWVREDAREVVVAVTVGPDASFPATVDFATADILALAGSDYTATNGTLNFSANELRKRVRIPILQDSLNEATENFRFNLSNPVGDLLGARSGPGQYHEGTEHLHGGDDVDGSHLEPSHLEELGRFR